MRYCYANRRHTLYPDTRDTWTVSAEAYTDAFIGKMAGMGFQGIEIGSTALDAMEGDEGAIKAFGKRLRDAGAPAAAIRSGGSLTAARDFMANRDRVERTVRAASLIGAEIVNGALSARARYPGKPGSTTGWYISQDSSRDATIFDFERTADELRKAADQAADDGITLSVEVHQNSIVDNSWSALLLHQLVDRENFGINPDLGNILWTYDVPEEETDDAIKALAPVSVYWHCKNLLRVYHPENERGVYLRVPLSDGEIDYRFAISAMVDADYQGYMAIEGATIGDQFHADAKSLGYAKQIVAELEAG